MTPEQALNELCHIDNSDQELAHVEADNILCALLVSLGYSDIVAEYDKIPKWFA